ncbi:4-alpha-glucanotransferase [Lentzea sp. NPDC042327]|uniref:4-alpha-glucanotransferase n=1 Tax=Lentzea sp. NPDC042327 TaxID=3154801 RepID=UPI00340B60CA
MEELVARLADAWGVATRYENSDQQQVTVETDVVVAVLAQFGVDASTPDSVERELALVERRRAEQALPPTIVIREQETYDLRGPATVELEDGGTVGVERHLPDSLPLGWHTIRTATQTVTLAVAPRTLPDVPHTWGWMLQLYAARSQESWGMGDFADLATVARRSSQELDAGVVLVNPVQAPSLTHPVERSPYSPTSRRFANPLYLRITDTAEFLQACPRTRQLIRDLRPANEDLIDYDAVWDAKRQALELLFPGGEIEMDADLERFATYCALAEVHGSDWRTWPADRAEPPAERVAFHAWVQHLCTRQLQDVRLAAHEAGMAVGVIHDLPVGVHPGGADTFADPDAFAIDVKVGAPPDAFSADGQDWGLPPWRPDKLAETGYRPFRQVLRSVLRHADGIRIDHVAGLWRLWWIPPGEPPSRGTYVHYDADAMLGVLALEAYRAGAVVVGEDLGTVEPVVTKTLQENGMLTSAVLYFQRDYYAEGHPLVPPAQWNPKAMASISTHDLPTAATFFAGEDGPDFDELMRAEGIDPGDRVAGAHELLAHAPCALVLTSPQDALGDTRQPNVPGTVDEHPNWRIPLPVPLDEFFPLVRDITRPLRQRTPETPA